jgi:Skp family chaperone for outer membrane proteins
MQMTELFSATLGRVAARLIALLARGACAAALLVGPAAFAQDNPAWFVPKPAASAAPAPAHGRAMREPAEAAEAATPTDAEPPGQQQDDQQDAVPQYNLPALAPLPPLPKTAPPPTAVIGVLGVPDVMRASTAAQAVQKVIGGRRDRLAADYQKEQQVWRDMQQALVDQRSTLSQAQLQEREKALQDRVAKETKEFRARNRVIQEAGQICLAQIERVLVAVIRQVSESRGMNLVLHRQQVALNVSEFDITDQVTAQLNTLLPSVTIPPEGEEPTAENTGGALPADASAPAATAVAAPAPR